MVDRIWGTVKENSDSDSVAVAVAVAVGCAFRGAGMCMEYTALSSWDSSSNCLAAMKYLCG